MLPMRGASGSRSRSPSNSSGWGSHAGSSRSRQGDCAARIAERRFEAALVEWSLPAFRDIGEVYESGGALNLGGFADAATDSLVSLARSAAADTIPNRLEAGRAPRDHDASRDVLLGGGFESTAWARRRPAYRRDPLQPYGDLLTLERQTSSAFDSSVSGGAPGDSFGATPTIGRSGGALTRRIQLGSLNEQGASLAGAPVRAPRSPARFGIAPA